MPELRECQRIMVVGCSGSGKSTLAGELGKRLSLPVVHLDQHYWRPGWVEPESDEVWRDQVRELAAQEWWIIDGNYTSTWDIRLPAADAFVWLDFPMWRCLWRILKRWRLYYGTNRPDIPEGCDEKMDWEFLEYVVTWHKKRRPSQLSRLHELRPDITPIILKTPQEVNSFLASL